MSAVGWHPGQNVPRRYAGMPVTFAWNEVALTSLLRALESEYPSGYTAMVESVRDAMRDYTPPKPNEPQGLGAVVEDAGDRWVLADPGDRNPWHNPEFGWRQWGDFPSAVRVLSEGVSA